MTKIEVIDGVKVFTEIDFDPNEVEDNKKEDEIIKREMKEELLDDTIEIDLSSINEGDTDE